MVKPTPTEKVIDLGDGRTITIETGKLAKQADGSVMVKCGGTYLLARRITRSSLRALWIAPCAHSSPTTITLTHSST